MFNVIYETQSYKFIFVRGALPQFFHKNPNSCDVIE